jgi:DNA topoisomerase-1
VAFSVVALLEGHFGRLVDYDFTAGLEDELERIAHGDAQRSSWLTGFYFGGSDGAIQSVGSDGGLKELVGSGVDKIDAREVNSIPLFNDSEGRPVVVRVGRYGPYLEREVDGASQRANLSDDLAPDELTLEVAEKLFATPQEGRSLGNDPVNGNEIVAKEGRFGPYVTDGEYNASLRSSQTPEELTVEQASEMLAEKRAKGPAPKKRAVKKAAPKSGETAAKKTAAKKTTTKKTAAKKAPAKKVAAAKKAPAKKAAAPKKAAANAD